MDLLPLRSLTHPLLLLHLFFIVVVFIMLPAVTLFRHRWRSSAKKPKLLHPPSPWRFPIIGNLHQLGSLPHRSLQAMSRRHGPLMLLRLGQVPALVVSSADMAREVMKHQDHVFASRPSLTVPNMFTRNGRDVAFAPYGDHWRQVKKVSLLHLLSAKMVRSFRHVREEEVASMVEDIAGACASAPGRAIDMTRVLNTLAKQVIGRAMLGESSRHAAWGDYIDEIMGDVSVAMGTLHVGDCFPLLPCLRRMMISGRVRKMVDRVDEIMEQIIEDNERECAAAGEGDHDGEKPKETAESFVEVLLSLQKDGDDEMKRLMTRDTIKSMIMDMYAAGMDSTHIVIEWAMAELVSNPRVMKKLQHEVRQVVGSKSNISEDDLTRMDYLRAVVKEAMRLHPPGPLLVPRQSLRDTTVGGYHIPKDTWVLINVWAIGRDSISWGETVEEFQPERFLDNDIDYRGQHFELTPFGAGRRICPGIGFAIAVIELGLATLMHKFEWKLHEGEEMEMSEVFGITMRKKRTLQLVATPCF
ncbi:cytochrome P450 71A1-like [Zingiber officinale]|nr:cytochrome P450 71A1-like [Zingiber officinale]